ncbi:hypothetical protein EDC04DRAFT_59112 [Pisolithus marmoratus]|nr:hypothetical protein EDC04DRAFT_59112 [Pisolithus marmoratus]
MWFGCFAYWFVQCSHCGAAALHLYSDSLGLGCGSHRPDRVCVELLTTSAGLSSSELFMDEFPDVAVEIYDRVRMDIIFARLRPCCPAVSRKAGPLPPNRNGVKRPRDILIGRNVL